MTDQTALQRLHLLPLHGLGDFCKTLVSHVRIDHSLQTQAVQVFTIVAKRPLPGPIGINETTVGTHTENQVIGRLQKLGQSRFRMLDLPVFSPQDVHQVTTDNGGDGVQEADPEPHEDQEEGVMVQIRINERHVHEGNEVEMLTDQHEAITATGEESERNDLLAALDQNCRLKGHQQIDRPEPARDSAAEVDQESDAEIVKQNLEMIAPGETAHSFRLEEVERIVDEDCHHPDQRPHDLLRRQKPAEIAENIPQPCAGPVKRHDPEKEPAGLGDQQVACAAFQQGRGPFVPEETFAETFDL